MATANEYNNEFAWKNQFGGGLVCYHGANPFACLTPSEDLFAVATKRFQARVGLSVDGYFGPDSLTAYELAYGSPHLSVQGIDVSGWQRPDDYIQNITDPKELHLDKLWAAGFRYMIIKALQGEGKMSRWCEEHTANAFEHQWDFSHYQFVSPWTNFENDSVAEADAFLAMLKRLRPGTFLPSMDFENKGYATADGKVLYGQEMYDLWHDKVNGGREEYITRMTDWANEYLLRFESEFGMLPLLYSYPSFLAKRVRPEGLLAECSVWLAAYCKGDPLERYSYIPAEFKVNLVMQQFTSSGNAASRGAYDDDLDLNIAPYGLLPEIRTDLDRHTI